MPYFLLTFGDASRPPVGAVIIEAPSMIRGRITAVVRRLAPDVPFGEGFELSAETIPSEKIGRMMSGVEAAELILRQAMQAKVLAKDDAHRIAVNVAKQRELRWRRDGDG